MFAFVLELYILVVAVGAVVAAVVVCALSSLRFINRNIIKPLQKSKITILI